MKTAYVLAIAATVATCVGVVALAASSHADGWRGDGRGHGGRAAMMFERFDTNEDGVLTRGEVDDYISGQFAGNDTDANGSLSIEEFEAVWAEQMRHAMVRAFQKLDRDGDGEVTREEADRPIERMFQRVDRDGNGEVELSEMQRRGDRRHHRRGDGNHDDN